MSRCEGWVLNLGLDCFKDVQAILPHVDDVCHSKLLGMWVGLQEGFFSYLATIDCSDVEIYAMPEGSVVFPKVPLIRVEGPLLVGTATTDL